MWPFKKKVKLPKPETYRWNFKPENIEEVLALWDSRTNAKGSGTLENYRFWKYVKQLMQNDGVKESPRIRFLIDSHIPYVEVTKPTDLKNGGGE